MLPQREKSDKVACASSENPDHLGYHCQLVKSVFAVRSCCVMSLRYLHTDSVDSDQIE